MNFQQADGAAPLTSTRPILSPSIVVIGAAVLTVVGLLAFRILTV
jgi:hypothetical protein